MSFPSRPEVEPIAPVAVIARGALESSIRQTVARRDWQVEPRVLLPLLHNHPQDIAPRTERLARQLQTRGCPVVLA
jgi:hypothetical protein